MKLSTLFRDGMILQRGENTSLWGKTNPDSKVMVIFLGEKYETISDSFGKFLIKFELLIAGGPHEMILDDGEILTIKDILIGDVWLLNGQSNMELPIRRTLDLYENEMKEACENNIRKFAVPMQYEFKEPVEELTSGEWKSVTPEHVLDFSATGYFFAKELYETYKVPIGLIQTAVGGTPIEAWLSEDTIHLVGGYEEELKRNKDEFYIKNTLEKESKRNTKWQNNLNTHDKGLKEEWYRKDTNTSYWNTIELPKYLEEFKDYYGTIWFKKKIYLSESQSKKVGKLMLGTLVDADETYINGVLVGSTAYRYPPRRYILPEGLLNEGMNTITVRLTCTHNVGAFIPDMPYYLSIEDENINLKGEWKYHKGFKTELLPQSTMFQYKPTAVYNSMLYPIRRYSIKGLAFYQGESNTPKPKGYGKLFKAYMNGIRSLFKNEELPIVYVQLPNFWDGEESKVANHWAELREEQRRALSIENTAMVVAIDIGQYNELHPQNKKIVGKRIANAAKKIAYGDNIDYSGPLFERMKCINDEIYLSFCHAEHGFIEKEIDGFEISEDGINFLPAKAKIHGEQIVVSLEGMDSPKHVRYAWADNPENVSLYSKNGLPAAPFSTTTYCGI